MQECVCCREVYEVSSKTSSAGVDACLYVILEHQLTVTHIHIHLPSKKSNMLCQFYTTNILATHQLYNSPQHTLLDPSLGPLITGSVVTPLTLAPAGISISKSISANTYMYNNYSYAQ